MPAPGREDCVTLSDRLWVPRDQTPRQLLERHTHRLVDPYTKQPYTIETFEETLTHYGFSRGNLNEAKGFPGVRDARVSAPFPYPLRFTGTLYEEQKRLVSAWIQQGFGCVVAPPRSGKTLVLTSVLCKLKQRCLMLAHRQELCQQLEETIRKFTNVNDLEDQAGIKLVGVLDEWDDFFPIATLSTYQCFAVSPRGRQVLQQHRNDFGVVMVDEVHVCKTELFREVVERTTAAYRLGVTATPTRKDGMHVVVFDTLGPVVATGTTEQLSVNYTIEHTGCQVKPFSNWSIMWNRLVKRKRRDKMIAKRVVEDVHAGHFCLVTTERLKHIDDLQLAIQTIDPDITVGALSSRTRDRDGFRLAAKRGEYQVVIAMNKIVELGYNIPRWSCIHNTLPMANRQNWYQRVSRIRTPFEPAFPGDTFDKPHPLARIWVDEGHPACYAYQAIVEKENKRLGFTRLNPPPEKPKGKRRGLTGYKTEGG